MFEPIAAVHALQLVELLLMPKSTIVETDLKSFFYDRLCVVWFLGATMACGISNSFDHCNSNSFYKLRVLECVISQGMI